MLEPLMQLELIRLIASIEPLIAASNISGRISTIIKSIVLAAVPAQVWLHFHLDSFMVDSIVGFSISGTSQDIFLLFGILLKVSITLYGTQS